MDMIVTTEKDAVRFPEPTELNLPIYLLRIEVRILAGNKEWDDLLDQICKQPEVEGSFLRNLGLRDV